ncbi:MAG: hypothetical protein EHM87_21405, partial [Burkholderiales bacterium]
MFTGAASWRRGIATGDPILPPRPSPHCRRGGEDRPLRDGVHAGRGDAPAPRDGAGCPLGSAAQFHEAKASGTGRVTVWGTGTPRREFLYRRTGRDG